MAELAAVETFDINTVTWSEPKLVSTRRGQRKMRSWEISGEAFWIEWRKGELKSKGYSIGKFDGVWRLTQWQEAGISDAVESVRDYFAPTPPKTLTILDADVLARYEAICGKLLPYQREHALALIRAVARWNSAVDTSDTGTGKTFAALAVAVALKLRVFVVTPLQVIPAWKKAAQYMSAELIEVINYERLRTGKTGYVSLAADKKKKFLWQREILDPAETLVIWDECHRVKDGTTQNCKMAIACLQSGYRVLGLSATAADNPMQMKFVALVTRLIGRAEEFFGWVSAREQGCKRGRFGLFFCGGRPVLERLHRLIFPEHGSRMRIAELGDQFPQTKIMAEAYAMSEAKDIQKVYDEMNAEIAKLKERSEHDRGASVLTAKLRARQRAELLKVPTMCQIAQDAIAEGHSVAMFLNFSDSITAMALRMGANAVIRGGQEPEVRQAVIDAFQDDSEPLIICNIQAGGVGISLHGLSPEARTRLAIISPTYSGQDLKQALGRVHRAGGARSIQKIIFAAGTVEEEACEKVKTKIDRISILNDGELDAALDF